MGPQLRFDKLLQPIRGMVSREKPTEDELHSDVLDEVPKDMPPILERNSDGPIIP